MRKPGRPATLAISLMLWGLLLAPAVPGGAAPDLERGRAGEELPRAPQHDGTFHNLDPGFHRTSNWTRVRFYLLSLAGIASSARKFTPLPLATPDVEGLRKNHHDATVTWIGHSTLLVQLDGVNILTDPYSPRFIAKPIHLSPEDALQAFQDLRATKFLGIHWGTFELAEEPYDEPPRRIADEMARLDLDPRSILLPRPGEVLGW